MLQVKCSEWHLVHGGLSANNILLSTSLLCTARKWGGGWRIELGRVWAGAFRLSNIQRNQYPQSMRKVPECSICYHIHPHAFRWESSNHDKKKEASLSGSEGIRMGHREAENSGSWADPQSPQWLWPLPSLSLSHSLIQPWAGNTETTLPPFHPT